MLPPRKLTKAPAPKSKRLLLLDVRTALQPRKPLQLPPSALQLGLLTTPQGVHFGPDQPHQVKVMYSMMDDLASVVTDGASVKAVDKIASQVAASAGSKAPR